MLSLYASLFSILAFVGRYDIAYQEEDRVVEKIGPGMLSLKQASESDPDEDKGNQE